MQKFFKDIQAIDHFTRHLAIHCSQLPCQHCAQSDQFVSHGFIYKQRSQAVSEPVGKRIFCSNRYGHTGCGRTFQLYIADEMPSLHYGCTQVFVFISSLFINLSVLTKKPPRSPIHETPGVGSSAWVDVCWITERP